MFYSQFILAKKGPLGTIWIAAHLERKLRKNQVADTDIGVSVDSILFPDVPIALRLSSHLLLGVVRIYSRKVNYLFDDCSEALLKVKQAFRSAAVDLPPEESKAPYHSITLPETFELDDFELPDNDVFHGKFVDHHISSREQITLQDTLDGATYSTSKFGLDERFGDGDASGLDLDEELFLEKVDAAAAELVNGRSDPQSSVGPMTPLKQEEHPEMRTVDSGIMVDDGDDYADLMEYAQAPCTPGLVEEPNLPKVQEVSACDDHMESEYHLGESMMMENAKTNIYGDKQEVNWSSHNNEDSDGVPMVLPEEYGHHSGGLNIDSSKPQGEFPVEADTELAPDVTLSRPGLPSDSIDLGKSVDTSLKLDDKIVGASHVSCMEDLQNGVLPVDENDIHQGPHETGFVNSACEISGLASTCPQDEPRIHETQVSNEPGVPSSLNLDVHEEVAPSISPFIRPCTNMEQSPCTNIEQSHVTDMATSGLEERETVMIDKACSRADNSEENLENHMQEHSLQEGIDAASNKPDSQVRNAGAHGIQVDNRSNFVEADLPTPEKLLSVPEDIVNQHNNMLAEISPGEFFMLHASDAASKVVSSKKRSFTESTLTEQSLNSFESSRLVRLKRTTESVPDDDDDFLSSILVGRSSVLKVKPSPHPSEVASMKRTRSAPRTAASKRKVLMDDTMVLHGDMIRQQLTNSEDIRRVRKKAPCTQSEISMIKKKNLDDEFFLEPLFTGMSRELASLHSHMWDFSAIEIENVADLRLPSENDNDTPPETTGATISCPDGANNEDSLTTTVEPYSTSHAENCDSLDLESGSGRHNVSDRDGEKTTIELFSDRDGESRESPPLTNHGINEVHEINVDRDVDADISRHDTLVGLSDREKDAASAELLPAAMDSDKGRAISGDSPIARDDGDGETEPLVRNDIFIQFTENKEMHSAVLVENPSYTAQHEGSSENERSPEQPETHQHCTVDARSSGFNLHHQEEWMFSAAGDDNDNHNDYDNDTGFLNVDDDDDDEDDEAKFMEKTTGWSSRTRAVCKYLERLWEKEEGRKCVSLDNLLLGKSRKEASRMFFETLVLKTRDYIHVEQEIPFGAIAIKQTNLNLH